MAFGDVIGRAVVIVTGEVDPTSLNKSSSKIGSGLKKAAVLGVASFGAIAAAGIKAGFAAEEARANQDKLNKVLANMGKSGAAKAVNDLADAESRKTGVDDDLIRKGQTILATFKSVAQSAGEVNGTFERATQLSTDLSAAGFGSVDSAAKALGKALQDPTKGLLLLTRQGVTFTETQKEQIKNFVKTGETAKAQDLILDQVTKKVGGLGEAGAKSSDKLKNAFGELEESAGGLLISLFDTGGNEGDGVESLATSVNDLADSIDRFKDSKGLSNFKTFMDQIGQSDQIKTYQQDAKGLSKELGHLFGVLAGTEKLNSHDLGPVGVAFRRGQEDGKKFSKYLGDLKVSVDEKGNQIKDSFLAKFESTKTGIKTKVNGWKTTATNALKDLPGKMKRAGSEAIQGFLDGLGDLGSSLGNSAGKIAQRFKDAINEALPDSLTFFGGKGGVPAITIPLPQLATGARNFGGGLALVGERGPEIVNIPKGSDVFSNRESQAMAGQTNYYNFYGPESFAGARRDADWSAKHGGRFGNSTRAVVPA